MADAEKLTLSFKGLYEDTRIFFVVDSLALNNPSEFHLFETLGEALVWHAAHDESAQTRIRIMLVNHAYLDGSRWRSPMIDENHADMDALVEIGTLDLSDLLRIEE